MDDKTKQPDENVSQIEVSLEKCVSAVGVHSAFTGILLYGTIENLGKEDYVSAAVTAVLALLPGHQVLGWYRCAVCNYSNNKPQNL